MYPYLPLVRLGVKHSHPSTVPAVTLVHIRSVDAAAVTLAKPRSVALRHGTRFARAMAPRVQHSPIHGCGS